MFRRLGRLATVVIIAIVALTSALTADEQIGAFLVVDGVEDVIALVGEITVNSPLDFRRALQKRPNTHTVITASPGGLVASALIIAQDLNARRLGTYIPSDAGCYSACAYVFLAGGARQADGELGVHQMASDVQDNAGIQFTVSDVLDTLLEFDTPREVISRMLRTPNEEMYVFSVAELETLGVNRPSDFTGEQVATESPNIPIIPKTTKGRRLAIYEGLDFYGKDISYGRTDNLVECTRACLGDVSCQVFTFNANPKLKSGPNCFLKSGIGRLEGYEQAISGLLLDSSTETPPSFDFGVIDPTRDVESGVRLSGKNMTSLPPLGTSLAQCRQSCIEDDACAAFSYRSATKQCLLKEGAGLSTDTRGYSSGVKRFLTFEPTEIIPLEE